MEKSYDPKQVETRWYRTWSERGYFHASTAAEGRPYVIVIPPPNITGSLHMGHALNNTIQDILVRWRRMQGLNALWVPGTDHAGIATQNVVEKQLLAEGSSRDKLGRDRFVQRVWDWKAQSGGTIIEQLKRLGSSCDWDRLRFTMDDGLSKAVREVFVRLHEDGLIYRGKRLINWCPRCLTALSDIEVEHEDTTGKLYHIRYPLADDPATHLTVATTRPETMLGDTGVAVHPEDPRYNRLIGKSVALPLTQRRIPIVGDPILVDREFGTGAVKITPAHDFNDFEAGLRHDLARLAVFDQHARMDAAGLREAQAEEALLERLASQPVQKARTFVVEALEKGGFLAKVEDHAMALGKCYRCKTVVEPYLSPQWFVKIQPLAEPAIKAVESGQIRLVPEQWTNNYLGWMRDIKDWCISRQIWWGHQIPAWYCRNCNAEAILETTSPKSLTITSDARPIVARTAPAHCPDCGQHDFVRDPDVLDTWFSSALWPFSTLGWPDQTPELKKFYPTSTLVTGFDILFFWVARMIMMGLKFMGRAPFQDVYIHALVRDAEGQKMSKSKGNVIDPLQVMDKYGTDALRFTLAAMASPGRDIKLSEERIEGYRNFANKLWNAARFVLMNLEGPRAESPAIERSEDDRWIMSRLNRCISEVNATLEAYRFDEAANTLYQFIWHEYCDQYIERAKLALADKNSHQAASTRRTLLESFDTLLRLLHPFMPFITEEIWQAIPHTGASIMLASYPTPQTILIDESIEKRHLWLQTVIANVASTTSANRITPSQGFSIVISSPNIDVVNFLRPYDGKIKALTRASEIQIGPDVPVPSTASANTVYIVNGQANVFVWPHSGAIDIAKEISRKEKRRSELNAQMEQDQKKLSNPDFVAKVPPDVLKKTTARHEECRAEHEKLSGELQRLREMAGGSA
ncbi:MAG: valine--tRNA ligase [Nitrospirota bacterium]